MTKIFSFVLTLALSTSAVAETQFLNQTSVAEKLYSCENGGTLRLIPTLYSNVKKIIFSESGSLDQIAFVKFWSMTECYQGSIVTSMTFPALSTGEFPVEGHYYGDMLIQNDNAGLTLVITSIRLNQALSRMTCKNY